MNTQVNTLLENLRLISNPKTKKIYERQNVQEEIIGVNMGPLRKMVTPFIPNHALALDLWKTNIYEARIMASMLFDANEMTVDTLEVLINSSNSSRVLDELCFDVFENWAMPHVLHHQWKNHENIKLRRAAWACMTTQVQKKKLNTHEIDDLLQQIETMILHEEASVQYQINHCLCEIGIRLDAYTEKCIHLGEQFGLYKDMKVAKGCTSPYAPDWISVARRNRVKKTT